MDFISFSSLSLPLCLLPPIFLSIFDSSSPNIFNKSSTFALNLSDCEITQSWHCYHIISFHFALVCITMFKYGFVSFSLFKFNNQINQHRKEDLLSNSLLLVPCYRKKKNQKRQQQWTLCVCLRVILFFVFYDGIENLSIWLFSCVVAAAAEVNCCYFHCEKIEISSQLIRRFSVFTIHFSTHRLRSAFFLVWLWSVRKY